MSSFLPSSTGDVDGFTLLEVSNGLERVPNCESRDSQDAVVGGQGNIRVGHIIQDHNVVEILGLVDVGVRLPMRRCQDKSADRNLWILGVNDSGDGKSYHIGLGLTFREHVSDV